MLVIFDSKATGIFLRVGLALDRKIPGDVYSDQTKFQRAIHAVCNCDIVYDGPLVFVPQDCAVLGQWHVVVRLIRAWRTARETVVCPRVKNDVSGPVCVIVPCLG